MAASMIPGQTAEIAGPKKAFVISKPRIAVSMINRANRPLLVVGSKAPEIETKDGNLIDSAIRMAKNKKMTLAATGHVISKFLSKRVERVNRITIMNLGDRLRDPKWKGFDGKGSYDLVIFVGLPYYIGWLVLSGLKNFAMDLKTMSLEKSYQPNASWSMKTMRKDKWVEALDEIINMFEEVK